VDTEDSKTPYREVTPLSRIPSQTTILTTQKDRMSAEKAIRNRGPIELRDRTDRDGQIHNMMPLRRWRRR